jgi:hypothetical protein
MVKITPGKNPSTHCEEGWFDARAGLRENGKKTISFLHRVLKAEPSSPQRVANVIEVPFPNRHRRIHFAGCISHILHYENIFTEIGRIPYIKS